MRPFFCYYGGKWRAAPLYPPPEHATVVEPFAGGAGYSLRYADRNVVLVEKDALVAALWRYLIGVTVAEILRLPDMPLDGTTTDDLDVAEEARWLIGFWLNKGCPSPRKSPSVWMKSGIRPKSFWGPTVRTMIASQVDRIRHWQVIEGSYEQAPNVEATWFVDPPYQGAGRHYRCSAVDHEALAIWCGARTGLTIVCESDVAQWLPFTPLWSSAIRGGRTKKPSTDAVCVMRRSIGVAEPALAYRAEDLLSKDVA